MSGRVVDAARFWDVIETVRETADGDAEVMAEALETRFSVAEDDDLRGFQEQLVAAHQRLYTWQHLYAAELICGFVSDDVFTDRRSWVITLGRNAFERVAESADNLADVEDFSGGCSGEGELFGAAVANVFYDRHGFDDETFPIVEPFEPPSGEKIADHAVIRESLPRLSARIPNDGLGQDPREFDEGA